MAHPSAAAELIMRGFNIRTLAHVLHLQTNSYAAHQALGDFYDSVVDLVDSYAENIQGIYGIIPSYPTLPAYSSSKTYRDGLIPIIEFRDWVRANRKNCGAPDETELQNIIDEIISLANKTVYKLRFLK